MAFWRVVVVVLVGSVYASTFPAFSFASEVGQFSFFLSTSCPVNWVPANGAAIPSGEDLYTVLRGSYTGTPPASINLPSVTDEFVRAWDSSSRAQWRYGVVQADSFQGHFHSIPDNGFGVIASGSVYGHVGGGTSATADKTGAAISDGTNGTPRIASETRPKNFAFLACVRRYEDVSEGDTMSSSVTLVNVSTEAAKLLNPGPWGDFTIGDISFWFGVMVGFAVIMGYKSGGGR